MKLKIATASINTLALDLEHNSALIRKAILQAHEAKADLLLLPELCLSGYGCEDMFFSEGFIKQCQEALLHFLSVIPSTAMQVVIGFPWQDDNGSLYNACAFLTKDKVIGIVCKQHLAKSGVHYEPRWFSAWPSGVNKTCTLGDQKVPVGDLLFDINEVRIGFEICEDAWAPNRVAAHSSKAGVDLFLNPSASHFSIGKHKKRYDLALTASKDFNCVYVYCNLIGCEAGRTIYDGGNLITQKGELLLQGKRFSFEPCHMELVTVQMTPKKHSEGKDFCVIKQTCDNLPLTNHSIDESANIFHEEEELSAVLFALALGLWDWQLKTRQKGYVISLSGGADSALCACAVFLAHQLAFLDLGAKAFQKAMKSLQLKGDLLINNLSDLHSQIIPQILTTVYQKSNNSGQITEEAAKQLAKALGATHHQWSIAEATASYQKKIEQALRRPLSWENDDIALQNIQARVRSPGIWMLANLEQKLLIATSNLSEASVGYCTMDGDTSGVLAPIGGISKSLVLRLNDFLCKTGLMLNGQLIKIDALRAVIKQNPTAELRPNEQSDEDDLMPFEVLDAIRALSQIDFYAQHELFSKLKQVDFKSTYNETQLHGYIKKYYQLYKRNQWKRERLAVSFHIEHDSACPKTYRRFPVLN